MDSMDRRSDQRANVSLNAHAGPQRERQAEHPPGAADATSNSFRLVFASIMLLVVFCLGVSLYLTLQPDSAIARSLNEKVLSVFTLGCGAIIGLLGGRTLR